jgi:hypothetical protein
LDKNVTRAGSSNPIETKGLDRDTITEAVNLDLCYLAKSSTTLPYEFSSDLVVGIGCTW